MSGPPRIKPGRQTVERIVREEAKRSNVDVAHVLGASNVLAAKLARTRAMHRITIETGCSHIGLEEVWGSSLRRLARRKLSQGYDAPTIERLTWRYGPQRAAQIAAGQDPHTQNDIAAWKRLCARGRAA